MMTVAELIAALEALGPEARNLPVVCVDTDYGAAAPEPVIEDRPERGWYDIFPVQERYVGERRVRL